MTMTTRPRRHRQNIALTLTPEAHVLLRELGGERDRSAVVEALLGCYRAGHVAGFEQRFARARHASSDASSHRRKTVRRIARLHGDE
jgi:hypothetical protein